MNGRRRTVQAVLDLLYVLEKRLGHAALRLCQQVIVG